MSVSPNPNDIVWTNAVLSQPVNLTDITGQIFSIPLNQIDEYHAVLSRSLIIFGVEVGMTFMLITVLLLLTKADKRRTIIFCLNIAGLSFQFLRSLSVAILYNGPGRTIATVFLGASAQMTTTDYVPQYLYIMATIFWYAIVETSLILQVRVVFGAERKVQRYLTYGLGLLGFATVATMTAAQSFLFMAALYNEAIDNPHLPPLALAARILFAVSIGISSFIFVAKLIYLINRRRKMGFKAFGPLQVILIMGAQCLIIPMVFFIADFYVNIDGFTTLGQTFLSCSLPLSALWASSEAERSSGIQVRPSFGNFSGTTASAGTEVRPYSKKSFFSFLQSGARSTVSKGSDIEKGSFTDEGMGRESDHVMIQRTLHVASSESPVPRSAGRSNPF